MEQLPSSSSSARSRSTNAVNNPYNKRPKEGKSYDEETINSKKGKSSSDRVNVKKANVSTPPTMSYSNIESYNVVTNTSVIPRSNNKNNKFTHPSTNNDSIHVNKKLHFDGDKKVPRSPRLHQILLLIRQLHHHLLLAVRNSNYMQLIGTTTIN